MLYQLRFWLMLRIGSIYRNLSNMWGVPHIRARGRNRITQWQSPVGLGFLMIGICPTSSQEGSTSGWWYRRGQISRATSKWVYVSDCRIQQVVFSHTFDEGDSIGSLREGQTAFSLVGFRSSSTHPTVEGACGYGGHRRPGSSNSQHARRSCVTIATQSAYDLTVESRISLRGMLSSHYWWSIDFDVPS